MRRIGYMIRKEFRQIFRDRPMTVIIFVVPLIQLLLLSYTITFDVKNISLLVIDNDNSGLSREIVRAFSHTERFRSAGTADHIRKAGESMQAWQAQMALVIPAGFARDLQRGRQPQLQVIVDGVDGNTAGIAMGYAQQILAGMAQEQIRNSARRAAGQTLHRLVMAERLWYNPELNSQQFMVPGIVVVLLTIIPMMLSAMSLVKEKEIGTLEQLMVTPLKKHQLLLGKIVPFLILSYVEMAIVMAFALFFFGIEMNGSYPLLALLSLFYLFTTIGLGIFISTFTRTQQQAMFVAWFFMVFMILMSGFFIPIENMPRLLKGFTYLNPMRYFMYIIRDIFQKGSGIAYLWRDALPLGLFGLAIFGLGMAKFRKRVR
ncbi:MAG: ABC transporter permease [Calditrichia bacterium]